MRNHPLQRPHSNSDAIPALLLAFSLVIALLIPVSGLGAAGDANQPKRLRRADSFLGIHFDFHAGKDCTEVGKNTTKAMVDAILDQVHPDYLQVDCKGHPGLSSYPTRVGNQAPGFVGDPLRIWRQATAARGVSLYMHYSGVWDSEAIVRHPDWGVINSDGKTNGNATSFFSPYADQLLIPQLRELAGDYGVDGVWVDGECWASQPDYSARALQAFREATGITDVPRGAASPHFYEFLQFNRDAFRRYLRHYIAEVKKTNPEFQLCSNWAFTDHMPEPVCAPVDFLSGDYSPQDSVNSARLSARYLARQGTPWDLMAWSFTTKPGKGGGNFKTAVQLEREAAVVLALGGGFQAYFTQRRDGSAPVERMPVMGEVARFCRERQAFCHHATQVPQVALLYSTAAHYRKARGLFSRDSGPFEGILQALVESQLSVELLGEHHLKGRLNEYPLVVIPEWDYLEPAFKADVVKYVRHGGNVLLVGPKAAALFPAELQVTLLDQKESTTRYLGWQGNFTRTKGTWQAAQLGRGAQALGKICATNDLSAAPLPAASITKLGRGHLAATYFSLSRNYLDSRDELTRQFLNDVVRQLFPKPMVEVKGSSDVDVTLNRIHGLLAVNLVNSAGPHKTEPILDSIPPVGPLEVILRPGSKPHRIIRQPAGETLAFEYHAGVARCTVPRLEIHDILMVE